MFENLLDYQVYVRHDLIEDNEFIFKTFGELKEMFDDGTPAVQYVKGQEINRHDWNLLYTPITKDLFLQIFAETPMNLKITCDAGKMLLLPDGNIVALKDDKVSIMHGVSFYMTTSQTRPHSTSNVHIQEMDSSTSDNILTAWLGFKDRFIYQTPETRRFDISRNLVNKIKNSIDLARALESHGIKLSESDLVHGLDIKSLSAHLIEKELIKDPLFTGILNQLTSDFEEIYIPHNVIKIINDIDVQGIRLAFRQMINNRPNIYSELLTEDDRVEKLYLIAKALDISINQKISGITNEIIEKLGPYIFQMLLMDKIIIKSDGTWRLLSISRYEAIEHLGSGYSQDNNFELLTSILCADSVRIGRYIINIENKISSLHKEIVNLYSNFPRGLGGELLVSDMRDKFTNDFLFEFFNTIKDAIYNMYEQEIASRTDLSYEQKRKILKSYMEEFFQIAIRTSQVRGEAYKILAEIRKDIFKYQSGDKDHFIYTFQGTEGKDRGKNHRIIIKMDKIINTYIPIKGWLFTRGNFIDRKVNENYEAFSSIHHTLEDISARGGDGRVYFVIKYWAETPIRLSDNAYFQPFMIDFTSNGDPIANDINFRRLYSAILTGKVVECYLGDPSTVNYFAKITRYGSILPSNDYEILLTRELNKFFSTTSTPTYIIQKRDLFLIPFTNKFSFFDYYLRRDDVQVKFNLLKKYLNLKEIKIDAKSGSELEIFIDHFEKSEEREAIEKFEEIFLEYYSIIYTDYGIIEFKLKEDRFRDEYLLYNS
ncbi:MAG: hypothetical protein EU532_14195 [Promethearchaeota archaeon]|nr:MAG: hypothetical protein EU532_14195 [Candidatus Lokiarchaeota archaeon]